MPKELMMGIIKPKIKFKKIKLLKMFEENSLGQEAYPKIFEACGYEKP